MRNFELVGGPLDGKVLGRHRSRKSRRIIVRDWRLSDPVNLDALVWRPIPQRKAERRVSKP